MVVTISLTPTSGVEAGKGWKGLAVLLLSCMLGAAEAYLPATSSNQTSTSSITKGDSSVTFYGAQGATSSISLLLKLSSNFDYASSVGPIVHLGPEGNIWSNSSQSNYYSGWLALINCDQQEGRATKPGIYDTVDEISISQRLGSIAAILYSKANTTCVLDESFVKYFNGSMDVWVASDSSEIESLYSNSTFGSSDAYWYNATALKESDNATWTKLANVSDPSTRSSDGSTTSSSGSTSNSSIDYFVAKVEYKASFLINGSGISMKPPQVALLACVVLLLALV